MPKTLLLADDSVVIQKLVGLSFANEDVELVTTDNGDDAITKARECRPDIVLADVVMPGQSGYDVCEAIKGDPQLAHVPVVLLTGTFEAFDEARADAVGSNGHITKPFEAQALVERVTQLLREAAAAPPPAPEPAPDLEVFDGGASQGQMPPVGRDASFGRDVTSAAEPVLGDPAAMPPPIPAPIASPPPIPEPVATESVFDVGQRDHGLPPLSDSDPLAAPLDLNDPVAAGGEHTIAMMPPVAEDDLLATSGGASGRPIPIKPLEAPDETPALDDRLAGPPPAPPVAGPLGDPGSSADSMADLAEVRDPSLTTIIMSEGDSSSDDISLGEPIAPVRSLDHAGAGSASTSGRSGNTMLEDDLFSVPPIREDTDSGFDFGTSEADAPPAPAVDAPPAPYAASATPDSALGHDPLAAPLGHNAPDVASQYDVSSSELMDPGASGPLSASPLATPVEPLPTPAAPVEDDIALTDGLLGAQIPAVEPPAAPSAPSLAGDSSVASHDDPSAPVSGGPDITPVMRDRIHDTLERVAWDALADLNETLIKQVVERVESIAWEVIPQMAEALVKEEIRRMKGEDE